MALIEGRWYNHERWWQKEGRDLGETLWAIATGFESDQNYRLSRARESLSLYEGRKLRGLTAGAYTLEAQYQEYDLNVTRAACDTVVSEIAGRQKPMPKFQTSDADWKTKRKAKQMEKFCLAVLNQGQGSFLNAWELMESCFLDAAIFGEGIAKVFYEDGRISIERHYAHELYVDPVEAVRGAPKNLFHVYIMERDLAIWNFARDPALKLSKKRRKEIEDAIEGADDVDPEIYGNEPRVAKAIKVVEAWRLQHAGGTPGKHAFAIANECLHEEEWTRSSFPFVHMYWEQDRMGWHGKGLVEQGEAIHRELNQNAVKLQERFRLCGAKRTYVEQDSVDMEDMQANEAEVIVEFRKGSSPPIETVPKPIAEAELGWMNDNFQKYFEITGVSQMRASARKEPGVTAGVAIRTLNDMQTARFALKAKGYENAFVQLGHQIVYCAREAAEAGQSMKVKYDKEIDWKNVDVPENTFDISIAPASSLPNDPAGRLQMAQELFSSGIVGVETFKQLLGWPDLEKEMNNQTSQNRYIEKIMDQMLDADPDDEEGFIAPDPILMDKPRAMLQCAQTYFDALYDGAPEYNLQFVRDYISATGALIAAAMPPPPPAPGGAAGAPPGGPGAPSGGTIPFAPAGGAPPIPGGGPGARPPVQ
jgi:hypothetical protein